MGILLRAWTTTHGADPPTDHGEEASPRDECAQGRGRWV